MKEDGSCIQDENNSISRKIYLPPHKTNNDSGLSMNSLQLPSEEIDQKYIQVPQGKVISSDEEWMQCGKWMWFNHDGDLRMQDKMWKELQVLLQDKCLIMIKSSTKKMRQTVKKGELGTIICYTKPGKKATKQAADNIRSITQDKYIMFYKDNRRTEVGYDKRFGYFKISTYMYTVLGRFYEKDELERWVLVEENEERVSESLQAGNADKLSDLQNSSSTCIKKNFQKFKLQPRQKDLMAKSFNCKEDLVFGTMICDCKNKDKGLTELERVWEAAKELLNRGIFNRIAQGEPYAKLNSAQIDCYIPNCSDITKCLKEMRKNIYYPHPIFFKEVCNEKGEFQLIYMQTAEGEFYKKADGEVSQWEFIPLESHLAL